MISKPSSIPAASRMTSPPYQIDEGGKDAVVVRKSKKVICGPIPMASMVVGRKN
jgi:hypothetical protein